MFFDFLHKEGFVLDTHIDTPSMMLENIDLGRKNERGHVDFIRMKEGGVDGAFFAIYIPVDLSPNDATAHAINLISKVYDAVDLNKDKAAFAFSPAQARKNKKNGLISVFLGMENGSAIQKNISLLHFFHRFGIRYLTLCHNANNDICDSCAPIEKRWGGISPFGREVVRELNRLGILIDCSHSSDDTFYDALRYSISPIVATHSCCRALSNHPRNLTDEMIKDLASQGGVVQVNFYPRFLDDSFVCDDFDPRVEKWQELYRLDLNNIEYHDLYFEGMEKLKNHPSVSYKRIADHIDHVVELVGPKHVGLGSDFDGIEIAPEGMRDISQFGNIAQELVSRGYSESDIRGIMGENFLRVMEQAQAGTGNNNLQNLQ